MSRYNDMQMDNNRSQSSSGGMNSSFDNNRSMSSGMNRSGGGGNNMGNSFDNDNSFGFEDRRGFALPSFQNDMNQSSFGGNDRQSNNNSMGVTRRNNNNNNNGERKFHTLSKLIPCLFEKVLHNNSTAEATAAWAVETLKDGKT